MFGLSTGQLVVVALVIAAAVFVATRPPARAYWRETPPMRRASIALLAVVAVVAVIWAASLIGASLPQ